MEQINIEERLIKIETLLTSQKAVLTLDEVSSYTGLSKSYLYKLTSRGDIPYSKPNGKQVYFDRLEIDKWLLRNHCKTNDTIQMEADNCVALKKANRL